jgi:hypothetical protein
MHLAPPARMRAGDIAHQAKSNHLFVDLTSSLFCGTMIEDAQVSHIKTLAKTGSLGGMAEARSERIRRSGVQFCQISVPAGMIPTRDVCHCVSDGSISTLVAPRRASISRAA